MNRIFRLANKDSINCLNEILPEKDTTKNDR